MIRAVVPSVLVGQTFLSVKDSQDACWPAQVSLCGGQSAMPVLPTDKNKARCQAFTCWQRALETEYAYSLTLASCSFRGLHPPPTRWCRANTSCGRRAVRKVDEC